MHKFSLTEWIIFFSFFVACFYGVFLLPTPTTFLPKNKAQWPQRGLQLEKFDPECEGHPITWLIHTGGIWQRIVNTVHTDPWPKRSFLKGSSKRKFDNASFDRNHLKNWTVWKRWPQSFNFPRLIMFQTNPKCLVIDAFLDFSCEVLWCVLSSYDVGWTGPGKGKFYLCLKSHYCI